MLIKELEDLARQELEEEKIDIAKDVLKSRITEIDNAEKILSKLKRQYISFLGKSVDDIVDEVENGNIRF